MTRAIAGEGSVPAGPMGASIGREAATPAADSRPTEAAIEVAAESPGGERAGFRGFLIEETIGIGLLVVATILAAVQITSRTAFDVTFIWIEQTVVVLIIWATYFGVSAITWRGLHIRMDVLADRLPGPLGAAVNFAAALLTCVYLAVVAWMGWEFLLFLKASGEENPSLLLPQWWLYLGFPIGVTIAFVRGAAVAFGRRRKAEPALPLD